MAMNRLEPGIRGKKLPKDTTAVAFLSNSCREMQVGSSISATAYHARSELEFDGTFVYNLFIVVYFCYSFTPQVSNPVTLGTNNFQILVLLA